MSSVRTIEPPPSTSRVRLFGAMLRELGRTVRARLAGGTNREQAALNFVRVHAVEGDAESVLAALDRFAREQRFLGNLGDRKGRTLDRLVAKLPANASVLELGTYCGYSAIRMARLLRGGAQVVSIEACPRHAKIARAMCRIAGVEDQVRIFVGQASALIPKLAGPFDLVFIDHRKDEYAVDLWSIEDHRLLEPGSIVVADNVGPLFDGRLYLKYVRNHGCYDSRYVESRLQYHDDLADGMEISVWRGARHRDVRKSQMEEVGKGSRSEFRYAGTI